jgi:hypothetical protein
MPSALSMESHVDQLPDPYQGVNWACFALGHRWGYGQGTNGCEGKEFDFRVHDPPLIPQGKLDSPSALPLGKGRGRMEMEGMLADWRR